MQFPFQLTTETNVSLPGTAPRCAPPGLRRARNGAETAPAGLSVGHLATSAAHLPFASSTGALSLVHLLLLHELKLTPTKHGSRRQAFQAWAPAPLLEATSA